VRVAVEVGVAVGLSVAVGVRVTVGTAVSVAVRLGVRVGTEVGTEIGLAIAVSYGVIAGVSVRNMTMGVALGAGAQALNGTPTRHTAIPIAQVEIDMFGLPIRLIGGILPSSRITRAARRLTPSLRRILPWRVERESWHQTHSTALRRTNR
jgi:hypothetical protein